MRVVDMELDFILDADTETEVIHTDFNCNGVPNEMFYSKVSSLRYDLQGKQIENADEYIKVKAIWHINLKSKIKTEVLPFGEFDIKEAHVIGNHLYFIKITNKVNNTVLPYFRKEIHRINIVSLQIEYCCEVEPYNFKSFDMATDKYLVFSSKKEMYESEEIVFVDLSNRKKAVLEKIEYWYAYVYTDYKFIVDEEKNPRYVIIKRLVNGGNKEFQDEELENDGFDYIEQEHEEFEYGEYDYEQLNYEDLDCGEFDHEEIRNKDLDYGKLYHEDLKDEKYMDDKLICFKWENFLNQLEWQDL